MSSAVAIASCIIYTLGALATTLFAQLISMPLVNFIGVIERLTASSLKESKVMHAKVH